jgi:hypothetical protein
MGRVWAGESLARFAAKLRTDTSVGLLCSLAHKWQLALISFSTPNDLRRFVL